MLQSSNRTEQSKLTEPRRIKIEWDDGETELWYDVDEKQWHRIFTGTPDAPYFSVTSMTIEDMEEQLKAVIEAIKEQNNTS